MAEQTAGPSRRRKPRTDIQDDAELRAVAETQESTKLVEQTLKDQSVPPEEKQRIVAESQARVEASLQRFPESPRLNTAAAEFSYGTGDYQQGIARADRSVTLAESKKDDKALVEALVVRGRGHASLGDYERAFADAEAALKVNPRSQSAFALKMLTEGRSSKAAAAGGQTAEAGAGDSGRAQQPAGAVAPASRQPLSALVTTQAGNAEAEALLRQAKTARAMSDWVAARRYADLALAKSPGNQEALALRAYAAVRQSDFKTALADAQSGLQAGRKVPGFFAIQAAALNELGDASGALAVAQASVDKEPAVAFGWLQRARAREKLNFSAREIMEDVEKARELDPSLAGEYEQLVSRLAKQRRDALPFNEPAPKKMKGLLAGAPFTWFVRGFAALCALALVWAVALPIVLRRRRRP